MTSFERRILAAASLALCLVPAAAQAQAARKPVGPASVKGTYTDDNLGALELVDGIAWSSVSAGGTVVFLTTKTIASQALGSACPMTEARAMILLRDAAWVEVTPDAAGRAKFFTYGRTFGDSRGGRQADMGDHPWTITLRKAPAGKVAGALAYGEHGSFDFEMPVRQPTVAEISEAQAYDGGGKGAPPGLAAFTAAFQAVRAAALKKDLPGFLAAQGFSAAQITAIRALPGIEDDFARLSLRFLTTAKLGKPSFSGRRGSVTADGKNAEGKSFYNYYYLTACGSRFVLTTMAENAR